MGGVSLFGNIFNITALYIKANNSIYWETKQSSAEIFYTTPINLPSQEAYGVGVELNLNPVKQWKMKLSSRLEVHPENLTIAGVHYGDTRFRQYHTLNNNFTFKQGWGAMLNAIFEPTYRDYDRTYHAIYNIGGQIYKSLFKDALQFTLNFNALGNRRRYDRNANGNTISYHYTTPVQSIGLSVRWRFSGGKKVQVSATEGMQGYKDIKDIR